MSAEDRWLLPDGIEEVFSCEAIRMERLRRRILDLFSTWGYRLVVPPLMEFLESLLIGTGRDLELQTFKLIDQVSGRLMGIRADMTPQVARIDARTCVSDLPSRLCYLGTVLHSRSDHLEQSRSPMQVGAELYGYSGTAGDFEIIRLMLEMFAMSGVLDLHLDLGHVGIYAGLARQAGFNPEQEAEFFEILQRKDCSEIAVFFDNIQIETYCARMLAALVELNGAQDVIDKAKVLLAEADQEVHLSLSELESIAGQLTYFFPALPVNFDLAELRGYHYQTGVVFAAFVPGYGREIARGGRYDNIGKVFGQSRPATGFSADLRVLVRLATDNCEITEKPSILAPAVDDSELHQMVRSLRASGRTVIQKLPGQSQTARALGCDFELCKIGSSWELVESMA
jgi:ATP phosphoribosyltransferase regulatory subunit